MNSIFSIFIIRLQKAFFLNNLKIRKLTGYKIPKRKFAQELENDILYNFVLMWKRDHAIAKKLIYPNSC